VGRNKITSVPISQSSRSLRVPTALWKGGRRVTQALALFAIVVAPLLGGWQRMDRNYLAAWDGHGWDLPAWILTLLPMGDAPARAHEMNLLKGGGAAVDYFGIPISDPTGGLLSLLQSVSSGASFLTVFAWVLPIVLALVAGRVFCGWFCPFGTLARLLELTMERLPFQPPRYTLPASRPIRFVLLGAGLLLGALGVPLMLYLFLPYVLVQQSIYSIWLMGGGGAAAGALLGLLLAGIFFGPTAYCATLCPTGAALAIAGHTRLVRLRLVESSRCGAHCDLCDRGCWLSLKPSGGDPGPDCDLCGRCTDVCPKDNLVLNLGRRGPSREIQPGTVSLGSAGRTTLSIVFGLCLGVGSLVPRTSHAEDGREKVKPRLLLEAHQQREDIDFKLAIVDMGGVRLGADDPTVQDGIEVSIYMGRGPRGAVDSRGKMESRAEFYSGPLHLALVDAQGDVLKDLYFERPNQPISTPHRSIYRKRVVVEVEPGDQIELSPIPGWNDSIQRWTIPEANAGGDGSRMLAYSLGGFLLFGGAISLALGLGRRSSQIVSTE